MDINDHSSTAKIAGNSQIDPLNSFQINNALFDLIRGRDVVEVKNLMKKEFGKIFFHELSREEKFKLIPKLRELYGIS